MHARNNSLRKNLLLVILNSLVQLPGLTATSADTDIGILGQIEKDKFSINASIQTRLILLVSEHILSTESKCTLLTFVFLTAKETPTAWEHVSQVSILRGSNSYSTNIVQTLRSNHENKGNAEKFPLYMRAKYQRHCSVVILTTSSNNDARDYFANIALAITQHLPGAPHKVFYLFLGKEMLNQETLVHTRCIQNVLILSFPQSSSSSLESNEVALFTRNWNRFQTNQIGVYRIKDNLLVLTESSTKLFPKLPDYEGNTFEGLDTPFGVEIYTHFQESGNWISSNIASLYHLSNDLNATYKLSPEYTNPTDGMDGDGNWDGYTAPLIRGSQVFAGIVKPTAERRGVIYLSTPHMYDSISFIHALPKKGFFGKSLAVLQYPLDNLVWNGILASIALTIVAMQFIFWVKNRNESSKNAHGHGARLVNPDSIFASFPDSISHEFDYNRNHSQTSDIIDKIFHWSKTTLMAVLKPIMDQNGLDSAEFNKAIRNDHSRFIIGLWFLSLIVLGCAYKSKLIAAIVLPKYIYPPRTFKELIDSDFKIGVILWEVWKNYFQGGVHANIGHAISGRVEELSYITPEDFHLIFNGDQAIMGLSLISQSIGGVFLTDVKKRPLYMRSKDTYFTLLGSVGISPHYPYCLEIVNSYISTFESSGLTTHWISRREQHFQKQGQSHARIWEQTMKQFGSRSDDDNETAAAQFLWLLCLVMGYGSLCSFATFIVEWILHLTFFLVKENPSFRMYYKVYVVHLCKKLIIVATKKMACVNGESDKPQIFVKSTNGERSLYVR